MTHMICGQPWHLCTCCDRCDQPAIYCECDEESDDDN